MSPRRAFPGTRRWAHLIAIAAAASPALAAAQSWTTLGGLSAGGEYNDNYLFTTINQESAFTTTITPFVQATRKTEVSDAFALLSVGVNDVRGLELSSNTFASGRAELNGTFRDIRSIWTGKASYVRGPRVESAQTDAGPVLGLVNTDTATADGSYTYSLTERWSLGAAAGAYSNEYDRLDIDGELPSNRGYTAGAKVGYAFSDRTQLSLVPVFGHYKSDITRSDYVTVVLGFTSQISAQFNVSGSVGRFRSDIESIATSERRIDTGNLYGAGVSYAFSERTLLQATLTDGLAPSGIGTITESRSADASLAHRFSDRLSTRIAARYSRTLSPQSQTEAARTTYYAAEVGLTYLITEAWRLDAGYRHERGEYSQNSLEPRANIAFLSVLYNWPGAPARQP